MKVRSLTEPGKAVDFEGFFEAEFERLFQSLYLVCGNRTEAEDLAQETMVRVFERWDRVAAADSPVAYLYQAAFNLNRRRHRTLLRRRVHPDEEISPDPAQLVERRSEARRLLAGLPGTQREALVLVEWLGLTAEEAGDVLGIEAVSVRGRLHRARLALRKQSGGDDE